MGMPHTHTSALSTVKYAHKYIICVCTTAHCVYRIMSYLGVCGNFGNQLLKILYLKVENGQNDLECHQKQVQPQPLQLMYSM